MIENALARGVRPVDLRRMDARLADVEKLKGQVRKFFKIGGFDWTKRYDAVYLSTYAREKGWGLSRLTRAVETVDREFRIAVNREKRRNQRGRGASFDEIGDHAPRDNQ